MNGRFRYAVVGCGLMGAAAARHLAARTDRIALVGPAEPADKASHHGVFASHYDEGRIARTIAPDPVWAKLARKSVERYREIETASGIAFFSEVGSLLTGAASEAGRAYVAQTRRVAEEMNAQVMHLPPDAMRQRFPWFVFPKGSAGVFEERGAGHISPRRLVAAQSKLAVEAGATRIDAAAASIAERGDHAVVELANGDTVEADAVLVAAGGFSIQKNLLPRPLDLKVYARTVVLFEVSEADALAMSAMPSMIHKADEARDDIYMLPPIRYPDGRYYLKIGGDPDDLQLQPDQLGDWFRGKGRPHARDHLVGRMKALVPDLDILSISTASCVTSFTPNGYPAIGWLSPRRIAVLTGGCGSAAKSSDEIGRLGAELVFEGKISSIDCDFSPVERR